MNGRRTLLQAGLAAALSALLVGCSGADTPTPANLPSAGTLLLAPLQLSLEGQRLSLEAAPVVSACRPKQLGCQLLTVAATVRAAPIKPVPIKPVDKGAAKPLAPVAPLNGISVQALYLVTDGGVWSAVARPQDVRRSTQRLTVRLVSQSAVADVRAGQAAQVVISLKDRVGHAHLLQAKAVRLRGG